MPSGNLPGTSGRGVRIPDRRRLVPRTDVQTRGDGLTLDQIGERVRHKLYPYGFLQGNRHYRVAWSRPANDHLLYRLDAIEKVETLDETFERDPAFDIHHFASRSFGVFQEEPIDVVWKFDPEAAKDARRFRFHPTQEMEELEDGSLLVRFRAGGKLEMGWHLFTWGGGACGGGGAGPAEGGSR